jgi:asparagine synthase (glutamine-hydrolysing)
MATQGLWELLGEVLHFQDEPIYSITNLVGYELMRLTKSKGIKVILNGQGSDETIGGYPPYFKDYWCTLMAQGRFAQAYQEVGRYVGAQGGNRPGLFFRALRRLVQTRLAGMPAYRRLSRWKRQKLDTNRQWFTPEIAQQLAGEDKIPVPADLNASLADSIDHHPLPLFLRVEDRNSMAHSVECRLPFLDYRLVSLLFSLPPDWRLRGPWNKYVLREAMRGRIPESVRARVDKMGFPVPARRWVADALSEPLLDILNSGTARERGIYNTPAIIADIERHRRGEIDVAGSIFDVAQYEVWSRL